MCTEPTNAMTATQTTEIDFNDEEDNTTTTTHETVMKVTNVQTF